MTEILKSAFSMALGICIGTMLRHASLGQPVNGFIVALAIIFSTCWMYARTWNLR